MDDRERRVGKNEVLFREVNERIEEMSRGLRSQGPIDFLCECGLEGCTEPIAMTIEEYETVRANPQHFAVTPGHEILDVERVVSQNERFVVVEKEGAAADIAVETDPRA